MAKAKVYHYAVSGRTPFPVDMLRYDWAKPAEEADSGAIERTHDRDTKFPDQPVVVNLKGLRMPTEDRWRSHGN